MSIETKIETTHQHCDATGAVHMKEIIDWLEAGAPYEKAHLGFDMQEGISMAVPEWGVTPEDCRITVDIAGMAIALTDRIAFDSMCRKAWSDAPVGEDLIQLNYTPIRVYAAQILGLTDREAEKLFFMNAEEPKLVAKHLRRFLDFAVLPE